MKVLSTMTFNYPIQIIDFYAFYYNKLMIKGVNNKTIPILVAHKYYNAHNYNNKRDSWYYNYIISSDKYKKYFLNTVIDDVLNHGVYSNSTYELSLAASPYVTISEDYRYNFINRAPRLNMDMSDYSEYKLLPRTHVTFEFSNNYIVKKYEKVIYSYLYLHLRDYLDIYNINFQNNTFHFDIYFIIKGLEDVLKMIFKEMNILISLFEDNNDNSDVGSLNINNYIEDVTIDYSNGLKKIQSFISLYKKYQEANDSNKLAISNDRVPLKWGNPIEMDNIESLDDFLSEYDKNIREYTGYNLGDVKKDPYYNCTMGIKEDYSSIVNRMVTLKDILFEDSGNITKDAINMSIILYSLYKSEINDLESFIKTVHDGNLEIFVDNENKKPGTVIRNSGSNVIALLNDYTEEHFKLILSNVNGYELIKPNMNIISMKDRYKGYKRDKFKFAFGEDVKFSYTIEKPSNYSENKLKDILNIVKSSDKFTKEIIKGLELLNSNYEKLNTIDNIRLNSGIRDIILPEIYNNITKMNSLSDMSAFNELLPSLQELIDNINEKIENEYNNSVSKDISDVKSSIDSIDKIFNNIIDKNGDD